MRTVRGCLNAKESAEVRVRDEVLMVSENWMTILDTSAVDSDEARLILV